MGKRSKSQTDAQFAKHFQPLLDALKSLGGSGRPPEVKDWIIRNHPQPAGYLADQNKDGSSKFSKDVDWARFYLLKNGLLASSARGVWTLTDAGRTAKIDSVNAAEIIRRTSESGPESNVVQNDPETQSGISGRLEDEILRSKHRDDVLNILRTLSPSGFERLMQFVLREAGFENVQVTGRPGDGGIDGRGLLRVNPFVSFRVLFQCKRYKGTVGSPEIRAFRGARGAQTDKRILITTGSFSRDAINEACGDGAAPIELVDAEALLNILEQFEIGVRSVRHYEVDRTFFDGYRD